MATDYNVFFDGNDWVSKGQGNSRATSRSATQSEAYDKTRQVLENGSGGEIALHRKDNNQIRDKNTIKPAKDPRSTEG